jgi:photosystem II stability/assembly factor-like uncharacterized protein
MLLQHCRLHFLLLMLALLCASCQIGVPAGSSHSPLPASSPSLEARLPTLTPSSSLHPHLTPTNPILDLEISTTTPAPSTMEPLSPTNYTGWITSFRFLASSVGWLAVRRPSTIQQDTSITEVLRTTDSGKHWTTTYTTNGIVHAAFLDERHAWITTDGVLLGTDDGGEHWQQLQTFDNAIVALYFLSPQHGWLVTQPSGLPPPPRIALITTDGGVSWAPVARVPEAPTFVDAQNGWAISGDEQLYFILVKTIDAGMTWQPIQHPCEISYRGSGPTAFLDASHVWTMCYQMPPTEGTEPVFRTTDGGQTWEAITRFGDCSPLVDQLHCIGTATDLFFLDVQHGWLLSRDGDGLALRKTSDAGKTWHKVGNLSGIWGSITFHSHIEGFAWIKVGESTTQLAHTVDGGGTWTTIYPAP